MIEQANNTAENSVSQAQSVIAQAADWIVVLNRATQVLTQIASSRGMTLDELIKAADEQERLFYEENNNRIKELEERLRRQ
ncbi:MAG TPA: hypothetical protein VEF04_16135 [Blastocatellia bacterium]|nr:hypothetical protein [Blastocatellia bacterium]